MTHTKLGTRKQHNITALAMFLPSTVTALGTVWGTDIATKGVFGTDCLVVFRWPVVIYFSFGATAPPQWAMASSFMTSLDHTQRRTTVSRTPLDEWSVRRRGLYLTTHDTHNRQTSMLPVGFEPTISAGERPQTYALDRAAALEPALCYNCLQYLTQ